MLVKELAQCSVEVGGWVEGLVSLAKPECSLSKKKRVDIYVLELSACNNSLFPFRLGEVKNAVDC